MLQVAAYLLLGLFAGVASGLVGIGGGILIVPALVYLFAFSQHQAQGTTLALMVLPIGLLAALNYYREGYVDIRVGLLIALGFLIGGWLGSKCALRMSDIMLTRIFGGMLLLVALKMIFSFR